MIASEWSFNQHQYSLVHYKNCIFHGQIKNFLKQNTGILILDNGQVCIGSFKHDQLNGKCIIFINSQTYAIGSFSRGMLDGIFVIRNPKMTIYWTAKMNKIQGEIIVINYQNMIARNWIIQNGQGNCTNQISILQTDKQNQILAKMSLGIQPYGLSVQFLYQNFSQFLTIESSSLTQTSQISLPTSSFYKLKVAIFKDKLIQYGVFHRDQLNGLGYLAEGISIFEGRFKNGKLDGYGLKMDIPMEKIIYGTYQNGDIRTIDIITDNQTNARKQLKNYKKKQHIYSLDYCNNYFNERPILMLTNFLKTIEQNDQNFTRQLQYQQQISSRKGSKPSDQILTSAKLNLSSYKKEKANQKQQDIENINKSEVFKSRFKKGTDTNYIDSNTKYQPSLNNTEFTEGINEFKRINNALRKYK